MQNDLFRTAKSTLALTPPEGSYAQLPPGLKLPHLSGPYLIMVTPEWATEALRANKMNRTLKEERVRQWCDNLRGGQWKLTHQGICFYADGDICDGQHRLEAVKRTGIAAPMFVTYGFSKDDAHAVDRGLPRSQADVLTIAGSWGKVTPRVLALVRQTSARSFIATDENVMARLLKYDASYRFALDVFGGNVRKNLTCAPVVGAIALAHHAGVPETLLNEFANVLYTGVMSRVCHQTVIKFREPLVSTSTLRVKGSTDRDELMRRTQRAIEAVRRGETLTVVRAPKDLIWPLFE